MLRIFTPLLAAAALAVAGCGGGNDNKSSSSSTSAATPATTTTASTPAATSGGTVTVQMKNIQFAPKSVTVKVGQTIKWVNADAVAHNVTAQSGGTFKSSDFGQGGTYSYKAAKAGTIKYVCTLHPGMDGTIIVQ